MSDYISREAAIETMGSLLRQHFLCMPDSVAQAAATAGYMDGVKDADIRLRSIPAADVRPVVRGKWIGTHDGFYYSYSCSECGYEALYKENTKDQVCSEFCPNCGARMGES